MPLARILGCGEVAAVVVDRGQSFRHRGGTLAVNPFMFGKLPFDTDREFAPVSLLAKVPNIFVVHADVPAKDLREFVALAKKQPGKLYYGSAGNGSAGHLAIEYLKLRAGIDIAHVDVVRKAGIKVNWARLENCF